MKLKIRETLRPTGNGTYITSDPSDIAKKCASGKDAYRILYDAQTDLYMIGDAWDHIHQDLLKFAFQKGWYDSQRDFIEDYCGYYRRSDSTPYWCLGTDTIEIDEDEEMDMSVFSDRIDRDDSFIYSWLYCIGFLNINASDDDVDCFTSDGYDNQYEFPFGTLFTRGFELSELPKLSNAFSKIK